MFEAFLNVVVTPAALQRLINRRIIMIV